jgi:hypothetical protein
MMIEKSCAVIGWLDRRITVTDAACAEVAVVTFKPEHVLSWDYARESP